MRKLRDANTDMSVTPGGWLTIQLHSLDTGLNTAPKDNIRYWYNEPRALETESKRYQDK